MTLISNFPTRRATRACVRLAAAVIFFAAGSAFAKTPDGMPPSEETGCSDLSGAAFGLCNAYCEAQDCDVHPRPSCAQLRRNFQRVTGSAIFPCDTPPASCLNTILDLASHCTAPCAMPAGAPCTGDCNMDAAVLVQELALGCQIFEEDASVDQCPALDRNGDARVEFSELACAACNLALGCP